MFVLMLRVSDRWDENRRFARMDLRTMGLVQFFLEYLLAAKKFEGRSVKRYENLFFMIN